MKLYEVKAEMESCFDAETGEIFDSEKYQELGIAFDEGIEYLGCLAKNLKAEAAAHKAEKDAQAKMQKSCENKAESIIRYVDSLLNGEKFKSAKVSFSYRKSEAVEITDICQIPSEYLKIAEPTADKMGIKQALKAGAEIPGAELVEKMNLQMK